MLSHPQSPDLLNAIAVYLSAALALGAERVVTSTAKEDMTNFISFDIFYQC